MNTGQFAQLKAFWQGNTKSSPAPKGPPPKVNLVPASNDIAGTSSVQALSTTDPITAASALRTSNTQATEPLPLSETLDTAEIKTTVLVTETPAAADISSQTKKRRKKSKVGGSVALPYYGFDAASDVDAVNKSRYYAGRRTNLLILNVFQLLTSLH